LCCSHFPHAPKFPILLEKHCFNEQAQARPKARGGSVNYLCSEVFPG
jgi:hypothetical protein